MDTNGQWMQRRDQSPPPHRLTSFHRVVDVKTALLKRAPGHVPSPSLLLRAADILDVRAAQTPGDQRAHRPPPSPFRHRWPVAGLPALYLVAAFPPIRIRPACIADPTTSPAIRFSRSSFLPVLRFRGGKRPWVLISSAYISALLTTGELKKGLKEILQAGAVLVVVSSVYFSAQRLIMHILSFSLWRPLSRVLLHPALCATRVVFRSLYICTADAACSWPAV